MSYGKSIDFLFNQMRNGSVGSLAGGSLIFYSAGTTTPKAVWLDVNLTTPTTAGILTPYTLSADGTAELYASGIYDIVVKDSTGVIIYDFSDVEFVSYGPNAINGSLYQVSNATTPPGLKLPLFDRVTVQRTDATGGALDILPPDGITFQNGISPRSLYLQYETMSFIKDGTEYVQV
jgi:hypothetical protein